MNPIRDALYDRLAGDATLVGLLATTDSIYHQRAPLGAALPFVIFDKVPAPRRRTFGSHMKWDLWLVKAVDRAGDAQKAEDIDARVEQLLDLVRLTIPGHLHLALFRESDVEYPEADGDNTYRHCGGLYRLVTEPA